MKHLGRREFLRRGGAAAAVAALAGPFEGVIRLGTAHAAPAAGYGPLAPVEDPRGSVVRLRLPRGFQYRSFDPTGAPWFRGLASLPGRPDGMAAFPGPRKGLYTLVRNHEMRSFEGPAFGAGPAYDPAAGGGCTTVVVDGRGLPVDGWVSLNGTQYNCAGGPTPWGSWISCEETVNGPDVGNDFAGGSNAQLTKQHGFIFDVPSTGVSSHVPIRKAGRFAHEAAAVDPTSGYVYLTEDNFVGPSGFYRYLPPTNPMRTGRLDDGGRLQMLRVVGEPNADLAVGLGTGRQFRVDWVDIPDPDPTFPLVNGVPMTADAASLVVGQQGRDQGAALFSRLEGCYYRAGVVYFISTQGGPPDTTPPEGGGYGGGRGQVFAYHVGRQQLTVLYESPGRHVLDLPDNVVVSTQGNLLLCEDGAGQNFLRGLTKQGQLFDFAENVDPGQFQQEFAGATWSPDNATLFVNIQATRSYTIAIWGPWASGPF